MAALTVAAKKERNARILSFLTLGALVASFTSYIIAPRFQEPVAIADAANTTLATKILVNERLSLLAAQDASSDIAKASLLELQSKFPSATETATLDQAITKAVSDVGLSPNAFIDIEWKPDFISISDPSRAADPKILPLPEGEKPKMYNKTFTAYFAGDPTRLIALLDALLNLDRALVIDRFDMKADPKSGLSSLTIEARIFLMPDALGSETEAVDLEEVDNLTDPNAGNSSTNSGTVNNGTSTQTPAPAPTSTTGPTAP